MKGLILKSGASERFFWNIDFNVGPGSPNKTEDVQLVQLGYFAAAKNPAIPVGQRPAFAAVVPGAPYNGSASDPLTIAILTHQRGRGGTQDGHVSVIKGVTYDGVHVWMLTALGNSLRILAPNDYPRLDHIPQCPAALRAFIVNYFTI